MANQQAMQPFSKAWWCGLAIGTVVLTAVVAPRTTTFLMLLVLLLSLADQLLRPALPRRPARFEAVFVVLAAFAGWGLFSATWSLAPWHSLLKPAFLVLMLTAVWLALRGISTATRPVAHYLGEGALTAITIAYLLVAIEILTDQLITRSLFTTFPSLYANITKHVTVATDGSVLKISEANLNRRTTILIWLLWPAIILAIHDPNRYRRVVAYVSLGLGAAIIFFYGSHQTSQLALLGGLVAYGFANWFNRAAVLMAVTGIWSAAVLLAVPIALLVFHANLHQADWLFHSARHRVVIWGTAAEEVMRSPVIGIGADATRVAMRKAVSNTVQAKPKRDLGRFESGYANHAHNVYLQVWYELGAIGALLFLSIGLLTLQAIAKLQASAQPAAISMFVTTSLLIGFSYSMWQTWFISALGLAIALFAIALRKRSDQLQEVRDSNPLTEGAAASQSVGRKT